MLGEPTGNGGRMTRMLGALPFVEDPSVSAARATSATLPLIAFGATIRLRRILLRQKRCYRQTYALRITQL